MFSEKGERIVNHDLKIAVPYYNAVKSGDKRFEIRYNDRGFQKGDTIKLMAYDGCILTQYEPICAVITYVTSYNQKENWCVFGFELLEKTNEIKEGE